MHACVHVLCIHAYVCACVCKCICMCVCLANSERNILKYCVSWVAYQRKHKWDPGQKRTGKRKLRAKVRANPCSEVCCRHFSLTWPESLRDFLWLWLITTRRALHSLDHAGHRNRCEPSERCDLGRAPSASVLGRTFPKLQTQANVPKCNSPS